MKTLLFSVVKQKQSIADWNNFRSNTENCLVSIKVVKHVNPVLVQKIAPYVLS